MQKEKTEENAVPLIRYNLHDTAKVTAEHHMFGVWSKEGKPQNLLNIGEEAWNKWAAENHNQSWVEVEFADRLSFQGVGFKSPGDNPRKTPTEVRILIWTLQGVWHEIGNIRLDFCLENWRTIKFQEIKGDTTKVRFEFVNDRNEVGLQLAEIIFYHL